jgi:hypothetical protein
MRAVQVAIVIVCITMMQGFIASTGIFNTYSENPYSNPNCIYAQTSDEQQACSYNILSALWATLTWGWITQYFQPLYGTVTIVKTVVDAFILIMNGVSGILIGVSFIQFLRNLLFPLRGA